MAAKRRLNGLYGGPSDALRAIGDPKTPCRNDPGRPCMKMRGDRKVYPTTECLPHECGRGFDNYKPGEIPHEWARDSYGDVLYDEIGDYHGGPTCVRCKHTFCQFCRLDVWTELCFNQDALLPFEEGS